MVSRYYVEPAGAGVGQGLAGIGAVLRDTRERKEAESAEEAERQQQAQMQSALYDAFQSGDPMRMAEVSMQYPQVAELAKQGMGMLQDYQVKEATDFATQVLTNPHQAAQLAERRIQLLNMQGRDPKDTMAFYDAYLQNPEGAIQELQMSLASLNPEAYKAYRDMTETDEMGTKVVGDFLVDNAGNVLFDASQGQAEGVPEHGVTPLIFRDPATGAYQAYLPNKAGGMTAIETPAGQEFVPDAARMGFNPVNIAERAEAEVQAERLKQMPAQQRALLRKQQQATLVDDTIDRALEKTGFWTTGLPSKITSMVPGSESYDLGQLLQTIKANVGFDKLQEMREQSPTGGALGQVSDFENRQLQAIIASMEQSQSEEQFRDNLELVRDTVRNIVHGSEQQFINTFSGLGNTPTTTQRMRFNPATGEIE